MALQCYKKALETDAQCVYALHQSSRIYSELGNAQAEIQALHILHLVSNAMELNCKYKVKKLQVGMLG